MLTVHGREEITENEGCLTVACAELGSYKGFGEGPDNRHEGWGERQRGDDRPATLILGTIMYRPYCWEE